MSKSTKILLVAAALCVAGLVFLGVGYASGGRGTSVSLSNGRIAAYDSEKMVSDTVSLEEFDELYCDFSSYDFSIEQGDEYKLEYTTREDSVPQIKQDGKKLSLVQKPEHFWVFSFGITDVNENTVVLTVPKDDKIYKIDASSASGKIKISDINLEGNLLITSGEMSVTGSKAKKDLNIEMTSGETKVADCDFDEVNVKITSGDIEFDDCTASDLKYKSTSGEGTFDNVKSDSFSCDMSSGEIDAENITTDNLTAKATSGSIKFLLEGASNDYRFNVDKTSGKILIGGGSYDSGSFNEAGEKQIDVEVTSGSVEIDFTKK